MISFCIPGKPPTVTAQQKGQNRFTGAYYKPPPLRDAEALYMDAGRLFAPREPLAGAVVLEVTFVFPLPRGAKRYEGAPKTTRPDTDNMVKLLKDCLGKCGFYRDDAQVADEQVRKIYGAEPCTRVRIWTWKEYHGGAT